LTALKKLAEYKREEDLPLIHKFLTGYYYPPNRNLGVPMEGDFLGEFPLELSLLILSYLDVVK
jgi:hypothetical protein